MSKLAFTITAVFILGGACKMRDDLSEFDCQETVTNCRLTYSAFAGYQRSCNTECDEEVTASNRAGGDGRRRPRPSDASAPRPAEEPGAGVAAPARPGAGSVGAATPLEVTRFSAFDIPCARDNQCGPGKCVDGDCYYGCHSDAQCGSGDRCSQETGARVCQPDPNPPVGCTRTAQCDDGFVCLNGGCRQECDSTEQCTNLLDRCGSGVCVPDRRPIAECVLNSECEEGSVCLDGSCVPACADTSDAGVCLAEPPPLLSGAPGPSAPEAPTESSSETPVSAPEPDEGPLTPPPAGETATPVPAGDAGVPPLAVIR